jgi:cytochrome P450
MESEEVDGDRTILGKLVNAVDPETKKKLSQLEIITNSSLLMYTIFGYQWHSMAASDTTAVAITFILYFLLTEKKYWVRLAKEIREKYESPEEITHFSTSTVPFLDAVVSESISPSFVNIRP